MDKIVLIVLVGVLGAVITGVIDSLVLGVKIEPLWKQVAHKTMYVIWGSIFFSLITAAFNK